MSALGQSLTRVSSTVTNKEAAEINDLSAIGPKRLTPMTMPVSLAAWKILQTLKQRRLELGLTQREVAGQVKAGGSQGNFSDLERGTYAPNLATFIRWAQALDFEIVFVRKSGNGIGGIA